MGEFTSMSHAIFASSSRGFCCEDVCKLTSISLQLLPNPTALVGIRFDIGVIAYIHILIDDSICYSAILLFEQLVVYEY